MGVLVIIKMSVISVPLANSIADNSFSIFFWNAHISLQLCFIILSGNGGLTICLCDGQGRLKSLNVWSHSFEEILISSQRHLFLLPSMSFHPLILPCVTLRGDQFSLFTSLPSASIDLLLIGFLPLTEWRRVVQLMPSHFERGCDV